MKTCVKCGKKGLFLWLSKSGYCIKCAQEIYDARQKDAIENAVAQAEQSRQAGKVNQKGETTGKPGYTDACTSMYKLGIPLRIEQYRVKYQYKDVKVAGVQYNNADFSVLKIGDKLEFTPEPQNQYDDKAILISSNGMKLGHVHKGQLQEMINRYIKQELPFYAAISKYDSNEGLVEFYLTFYYDPLEDVEGCEHILTKLTKTSKKDALGFNDRQDNLMLQDSGDVFKLDYNDETETYWVYDELGLEIGELSKAISAKLAEKEVSCRLIAIANEIGEDENGKPEASIKVYFK